MDIYPQFVFILGPIILLAASFPVLICLIWAAATHNRLVSLRNLIDNAWSNVDTKLRRRYDLIPNLVETVRFYAAHERAVIEPVVQARANAVSSTGSPEEQAAAENELVRLLRSLFAVCESYPVIKADQNFLALQRELVNTEDRIQAARRFFNGNVRECNSLVECFPSSLIARTFGFRQRQYFEIEDAIQWQAPPVWHDTPRAADPHSSALQ